MKICNLLWDEQKKVSDDIADAKYLKALKNDNFLTDEERIT